MINDAIKQGPQTDEQDRERGEGWSEKKRSRVRKTKRTIETNAAKDK